MPTTLPGQCSNPSHSQQHCSRNEETWVIVPTVKLNLQNTGHQTQEHHRPMGCMHVVIIHKRDADRCFQKKLTNPTVVQNPKYCVYTMKILEHVSGFACIHA